MIKLIFPNKFSLKKKFKKFGSKKKISKSQELKKCSGGTTS